MEYYYTVRENISEDKLLIKGNEAGHLRRVLRKKISDEIYVTDGERNLYKALISKIENEKIECKILERKYNVNEPGIKVGLFQSLLKNPDRFEFVIEKATELGVSEIYPLISENVVNKTGDRQERWQAIALSAMKQSQRVYLPKVNHPLTFDETLKKVIEYEMTLIAHERVSAGAININKAFENPANSICILVGPEGGFSGEETEKAMSYGFKLLNLGNRKLRSETAAIIIMGFFYNKTDKWRTE